LQSIDNFTQSVECVAPAGEKPQNRPPELLIYWHFALCCQ